VTSLSLAALIQVSLLTMGAETYADAYRATVETGRPLVVLVGADWCAACRAMEQTVLPEIRQRGILGKVAFAMVNLDRDRELGDQLTAHGPIPQLLLFRKAEDGWKLRRLIGGQTVETVESFIQEGVKAELGGQKAKADVAQAPPATGAPMGTQRGDEKSGMQ